MPITLPSGLAELLGQILAANPLVIDLDVIQTTEMALRTKHAVDSITSVAAVEVA